MMEKEQQQNPASGRLAPPGATATYRPLILASESPRRKELLEKINMEFSVRKSDIDETIYSHEAPYDYVLRMAREKAAKVACSESQLPGHGPSRVIAADTSVVVDQEILGKPTDPEDARRMLRMLSGRAHLVLTAVCLLETVPAGEPREVAAFVEETQVVFAPLTEEEIRDYIHTGEPMDKAGAYGIQGRGAVLVEGIRGCYYNVMGLPLRRVYEVLTLRK